MRSSSKAGSQDRLAPFSCSASLLLYATASLHIIASTKTAFTDISARLTPDGGGGRLAPVSSQKQALNACSCIRIRHGRLPLPETDIETEPLLPLGASLRNDKQPSRCRKGLAVHDKTMALLRRAGILVSELLNSREVCGIPRWAGNSHSRPQRRTYVIIGKAWETPDSPRYSTDTPPARPASSSRSSPRP